MRSPGQPALGVDLGVGLGDVIARLLHGREVGDLVGQLAFLHLAVGALDEAVLVDARERGQAVDEADVGAFRRLDRADAAVVRRVHVAHLEACTLARETAGAERREAPLVRDLAERVGLVHELAELRGAEELTHRRSRRLGVDEVLRHHRVDIHRRHALLDGALHAQQAQAVLVLHQLADRAHPAVAEVVDVVDLAFAVAQVHQRPDHGDDVLGAQRAHRVVALEIEPHVHLDAADGREVVALRIEEQRVEERRGRIDGRRLARAHHPVDVHQRALLIGVLVDVERIADERADRDMIDVEDREVLDLRLLERLQQLGIQLVAGLAIDLAGLHVDDVLGQVLARKIGVVEEHLLQALLAQLARAPCGDLLAGLDHHLAGLGVDEVGRRRETAHLLRHERNLPAELGVLHPDGVVEGAEDGLLVEAERIQQRRHMQLAAPVDAHKDDVLGVELEVEPRAAVGDDAGREQVLAGGVGLALVVVEEHAGRAVHLADDDALGAVDDEGAVGRHERHVAHVDVLLLHVLDGLGAGLLVHVEHDQAQFDLERRGEGHVALLALVDVVLGRLELVALEVERGPAREVGDREDGLEDGLQSLLGPPPRRLLDHQEVVVGALLHLDEVRHLGHLADGAEFFPDALAATVGFSHLASHVLLAKGAAGGPRQGLGTRRGNGCQSVDRPPRRRGPGRRCRPCMARRAAAARPSPRRSAVAVAT